MMNKKVVKSQSSVEFIVILTIVLIFFSLIVGFMMTRLDSVLVSQRQNSVSYVLDVFENELLIAKGVSGNYERTFELPTLDFDYTLNVNFGREVVVSSLDDSQVRFLNSFIYTNLTSLHAGSQVYLIKRGSQIGFCSGLCLADDLFKGDGSLQCNYKGKWTTCPFEFMDYYDEMRFECGSMHATGTLKLFAVDDNYYPIETVGTNEGSYVYFSNLDFRVNESGYWDVNISCGLEPEFNYNRFYVPYGYFEFYPIELKQGCFNNSEGILECLANKNFTVLVKLKCLGGECGNAQIWLDP